MAEAGSSAGRVKRMERLIAALVAGGLVLGVLDVVERRDGLLAAPALAQSAQPVAPWTWAPPAPRPSEPAVVPPAPAATDRAAPPPRTKRLSPSPGSPSPAPSIPAPSGRTLDTAPRPTPAPAATAASSPRAGGAEDGSAAIDWLLKE